MKNKSNVFMDQMRKFRSKAKYRKYFNQRRTSLSNFALDFLERQREARRNPQPIQTSKHYKAKPVDKSQTEAFLAFQALYKSRTILTEETFQIFKNFMKDELFEASLVNVDTRLFHRWVSSNFPFIIRKCLE